jgi:muconate cycloisomerase
MKRREFIRTASSAAVGLGLSGSLFAAAPSKTKIARIDLFPLYYPMIGTFKFFAVPIAQWSYETLETAVVVLRDYYAPVLVGRDPADIEGAHAAMDQAVAPGFSTGMPISRAGIDLALHDLAGRRLGRSLAGMWGKPAGGPITLSWTVNVKKLDEVGPIMDEGKRRGFRNFNIKIAPDPDFDVALAREVRRRAPDSFLWADANGGYDPETALRRARFGQASDRGLSRA